MAEEGDKLLMAAEKKVLYCLLKNYHLMAEYFVAYFVCMCLLYVVSTVVFSYFVRNLCEAIPSSWALRNVLIAGILQSRAFRIYVKVSLRYFTNLENDCNIALVFNASQVIWSERALISLFIVGRSRNMKTPWKCVRRWESSYIWLPVVDFVVRTTCRRKLDLTSMYPRPQICSRWKRSGTELQMHFSRLPDTKRCGVIDFLHFSYDVTR